MVGVNVTTFERGPCVSPAYAATLICTGVPFVKPSTGHCGELPRTIWQLNAPFTKTRLPVYATAELRNAGVIETVTLSSPIVALNAGAGHKYGVTTFLALAVAISDRAPTRSPDTARTWKEVATLLLATVATHVRTLTSTAQTLFVPWVTTYPVMAREGVERIGVQESLMLWSCATAASFGTPIASYGVTLELVVDHCDDPIAFHARIRNWYPTPFLSALTS